MSSLWSVRNKKTTFLEQSPSAEARQEFTWILCMEPDSSLPHSQHPTTCPYSKPDLSNLQLPPYLLYIRFNIILSCMPTSYELSLSLSTPHQNLYEPLISPIPATCPPYLILFDLITREEYRSCSSSVCNFLHSPVISSFLDLAILFSTPFSITLSMCSPYHC
jgi:hypothetical protein